MEKQTGPGCMKIMVCCKDLHFAQLIFQRLIGTSISLVSGGLRKLKKGSVAMDDLTQQRVAHTRSGRQEMAETYKCQSEGHGI